MSEEEQTIYAIKVAIEKLSAAERQQCEELASHMELMISSAGPVVGNLALALVGAKAQMR